MDQMSTWEMLLLGAVVLMVLIWLGPGVKASLEQSRKAEKKDWAGVLFPVALVILFVIFLISMV
jgi:protein-S-isoprenylcysteine O-methyltransferase Ste14